MSRRYLYDLKLRNSHERYDDTNVIAELIKNVPSLK